MYTTQCNYCYCNTQYIVHYCTHYIVQLCSIFYPFIMLSTQQYHMLIVLWCYNAKMILWHWALLEDQNPPAFPQQCCINSSSQHNGSQQLQWMSISSSSLLNTFHSYLQESHCDLYLQFPTQLYESVSLYCLQKYYFIQVYTM